MKTNKKHYILSGVATFLIIAVAFMLNSKSVKKTYVYTPPTPEPTRVETKEFDTKSYIRERYYTPENIISTLGLSNTKKMSCANFSSRKIDEIVFSKANSDLHAVFEQIKAQESLESKTPLFKSICIDESLYYILVETSLTESHSQSIVHAAGGGTGYKTSIAIVNKSDNNANITELNFDAEDISPVNINSTAYLSCDQIIGVNSNEVLVSCAAGDGPISTWSLKSINLKTYIINEMLACIEDRSNEPTISCFNKSGYKYYSSN